MHTHTPTHTHSHMHVRACLGCGAVSVATEPGCFLCPPTRACEGRRDTGCCCCSPGPLLRSPNHPGTRPSPPRPSSPRPNLNQPQTQPLARTSSGFPFCGWRSFEFSLFSLQSKTHTQKKKKKKKKLTVFFCLFVCGKAWLLCLVCLQATLIQTKRFSPPTHTTTTAQFLTAQRESERASVSERVREREFVCV